MKRNFKLVFVCGTHRLEYVYDVHLFVQSDLRRVLNIT